jgi:glycosyltransferase involved in cell wall biosynthesis
MGHRKACFFSTDAKAFLANQQYLLQDVRILEEMGFRVRVASRFQDIPWDSDLYLAWWATGSVLPLLVAKLTGKPIIVVAGGNEAMFYRDSVTSRPAGYLAYPWHKKLAVRASLRFADRVVAVSRFMVDDVAALGGRAPTVAHNTVDPGVFHEISGCDRKFVTSILGFDANAYELKRGDVFLRSIPRILERDPDRRFRIIGRKGEMLAHARSVIDSLEIGRNVEIMSLVENSEVPRIMSEAIAYVQVSDTETFGLAVVEAMSCGAPVVVSSRGAIPEVVGDCGVFVDHNDPASVADGILRVIKMPPEERALLVARARERVERLFSYPRRKEILGALIRAVVSDAPRAN